MHLSSASRLQSEVLPVRERRNYCYVFINYHYLSMSQWRWAVVSSEGLAWWRCLSNSNHLRRGVRDKYRHICNYACVDVRTFLCTGVDFSNIGGANQNIGAKGGNNWWKHRRFSIIRLCFYAYSSVSIAVVSDTRSSWISYFCDGRERHTEIDGEREGSRSTCCI